MTLTEQMTIECPSAIAFDLMADVRKLPEWNDAASKAEMQGSGPIGQGTTFIAVNRGQEMKSTITEFDRPRKLGFSVSSRGLDVDAAFSFQDAGAATELTIEFYPEPKGIMKVLFPVLKPMIRRDLRNQHLKFKTFCETSVQSQA